MFEATQNLDAAVEASAALKVLAVSFTKIRKRSQAAFIWTCSWSGGNIPTERSAGIVDYAGKGEPEHS